MADFCVALRISPTEYRALTLVEYSEMVRAFSYSRGNDLEELV